MTQLRLHLLPLSAGDAEGHGAQQENAGGGAAEDLRGETRAEAVRSRRVWRVLMFIWNALLSLSQKACLTVEENTRLKSRLQAAEAEAVQRQSSTAEQDYEEVIQLLEAEIRDLKNQLASKRQARGAEAKQVRHA